MTFRELRKVLHITVDEVTAESGIPRGSVQLYISPVQHKTASVERVVKIEQAQRSIAQRKIDKGLEILEALNV